MRPSMIFSTLFLLLAMATADVVLDKKTMKLTLTAAELSALAYIVDPPADGYDMLKYFNAEPDQALVVKKDGYCFGVFRGTTLTLEDWSQNLILSTEEICGSDSTVFSSARSRVKKGIEAEGAEASSQEEPPVCCTVRAGFYDAYHTNYYQDFEMALRHCAQYCLNPDECVVLTGHSQGGAVASVAAITLTDLNPYVITFGQPPTLAPGCPFMMSERWYRWVNTRASSNLGLTYDPIPFTPGFGTECWGHFLVLGEEFDAVAYLGLDDNTELSPVDPMAAAHSMEAAHTNGTDSLGYVDRISALIQYNYDKVLTKLETAVEKGSAPPTTNTSDSKGKVSKSLMTPIPTDGFKNGALCTRDIECLSGTCQRETGWALKRCFGLQCEQNDQCETNRCDNGMCAPKLGTCQPCDEDSDCASGACIGFQCTGPDQLMDENCGCFVNSNCRSGRCEGVNPRICEALLPMDARCNEDSDCASKYCSWSLRCADPSLKQSEIKIESSIFSWRSVVAGLVVIVLCFVAKYAIEWFFYGQADYEEIPSNEDVGA